MADELNVNPILFVAITDKIEEDNPVAAKIGLGHIFISVAPGFSPNILSTMPPELMNEVIDWIVAHRPNQGVDEIVLEGGPSDSDTIQ